MHRDVLTCTCPIYRRVPCPAGVLRLLRFPIPRRCQTLTDVCQDAATPALDRCTSPVGSPVWAWPRVPRSGAYACGGLGMELELRPAVKCHEETGPGFTEPGVALRRFCDHMRSYLFVAVVNVWCATSFMACIGLNVDNVFYA